MLVSSERESKSEPGQDHDQPLVVKICDMGLAKTNRMLSTSNEVGTAHWAAPEALRHEPYTCAADVWSFGVILYELVTLRTPYGDMPTLQVAHEVAYNGLTLVIPPSLAADRPALAQLIASCWAQLPAGRPSFPELAAELVRMRSAGRLL